MDFVIGLLRKVNLWKETGCVYLHTAQERGLTVWLLSVHSICTCRFELRGPRLNPREFSLAVHVVYAILVGFASKWVLSLCSLVSHWKTGKGYAWELAPSPVLNLVPELQRVFIVGLSYLSECSSWLNHIVIYLYCTLSEHMVHTSGTQLFK